MDDTGPLTSIMNFVAPIVLALGLAILVWRDRIPPAWRRWRKPASPSEVEMQPRRAGPRD